MTVEYPERSPRVQSPAVGPWRQRKPTLAIIPHITRKPLYDSLRDFAPIILIASAPNVLVVHPSVPGGTVRELIALAKSRPE